MSNNPINTNGRKFNFCSSLVYWYVLVLIGEDWSFSRGVRGRALEDYQIYRLEVEVPRGIKLTSPNRPKKQLNLVYPSAYLSPELCGSGHTILFYIDICPGYWSDVVPPLPISNRVVKRISADDSGHRLVIANIGHSRGIILKRQRTAVFFWRYINEIVS